MKKKSLVLLFVVSFIFSVKAQQIGNGVADFANNFNTSLLSGFYQTEYNQVGFPGNIPYVWNHLLALRHSNPANNYQFQMATSYQENDRLFFRKIANNSLEDSNSMWHELATRGSNTFNGEQVINGNQIVNGDLQVGLFRGHENVPLSYAKKIDFGAYENYDNIWIARYNKDRDCSELRINIGDDNGACDRFAVGATVGENNVWKESFAVLANGNMGIGISNPQNKLDVNGTIRSKEVKVETGWADYVFKDSYQLPALDEVKRHIKENKHLPGMPTESEVEENGVNLGEMQVKLLQKIEELTLYTIQQQEMIDVLKEKIEKLENNHEKVLINK